MTQSVYTIAMICLIQIIAMLPDTIENDDRFREDYSVIQQDSALPHFAVVVREFLDKRIPGPLVKRRRFCNSLPVMNSNLQPCNSDPYNCGDSMFYQVSLAFHY